MVTKVDCARVGDQGYRNPPLSQCFIFLVHKHSSLEVKLGTYCIGLQVALQVKLWHLPSGPLRSMGNFDLSRLL